MVWCGAVGVAPIVPPPLRSHTSWRHRDRVLHNRGSLSRPPSVGPTPKTPRSVARRRRLVARAASASSLPPLDLTEDNIRRVLDDARTELAQIFDASVGITGEVDLAELDGPFVKLRLKGRFWHKRSTVVERLGQYLKNRIPEILEVDIEDEKQLDDSPENF